MADDEKSKNQILQALVALSHTLFHQAQGAACRTSSLALRSADGDNYASRADAVPAEAPRWLSRHLSLMSQSRWRSKQKNHGKDDDEDDDQDTDDGDAALLKRQSFAAVSHIDMQRVCCLFSIEVVAAQCLPPSMNGLLLEVAVRRKETRDGAVCTMPARVQKGAADFDETLYVRCHLYCRGGGGTGKPLKFEPLPFLLSVVSIDAPELDLGQSSMDLSAFVKEFTDKYQQRVCPRQWDATFPLAGKAKGGNLVIRLAFQIMEGLGLIVNNQPDSVEKATNSSWLSSFAPKIRKSSFIVMSPKMLRSYVSFPPKIPVLTPNLMDIEKSMLDEFTPAVEVKAAAPAERKVPQHKPEEVKVEQRKETAEPERVVVKEEVQQKELEPEESKEEEDQKDSDPEPKPEDEKYDDLKLPNFYLEDKGLKGKEEAEAEKTLEATVLGAMSGMAANSVEHPGTNCEEVIGESQKPLEANWEEVTGESLQLPEANGEEVTRVSLLLSEVNVEEVTKVFLLTNIDNFKLEELAPAPEVKAAAQAEQKGSEHKLEEVKVEQLKETAEPEPIGVEEEEKPELEPEPELEDTKEKGEGQKESDHEPEAEDEEFDDLDLLEFEAVVKCIEGQEVAEAEKALEAIVFNTMSDTVIELVEKWEANCEEVTGASQHPLEANGEEVTQESLQLPEANEEEVTRVSLLLSKANGEEVTRESLQPPEANMKEVTVESLQLPEANGEEVMGESLQPSETNGEEVTRGSLQLPDANWEEETGESLQPPEANMQEVAEEFLQPLEVNEKEVTGECLHPPEQGEVKAAAVKSPLRRIRWRTLATIITPVAVFVGKALARRKQWMNLTLEFRCHVVSHPNQSPHHHYVQHLLHCDLQCSVPSHQILSPIQ